MKEGSQRRNTGGEGETEIRTEGGEDPEWEFERDKSRRSRKGRRKKRTQVYKVQFEKGGRE